VARVPSSPLAYFLASFAWNYGLGMTWLAVPLYAHELGLSGAQIGLLFSLPVVFQIAVNLVGGAYVDRLGGRRIMLASSLLFSLGAAMLYAADGFWSLFAGQLVLVVSRASFWPANWSLASELPGDRSVQAGRLNAITSFGQILGNGSCGFVLATAGFGTSFVVMGAMALAAWGLGLGTPRTPRKDTGGRGLFANYLPLLGMPILYYAVMCAYLSALPFSLSMSFYPLLLQFFGFGEEVSGVLLALRALGGIGAGLVVAKFVATGPASPWPVIAGLSVAVAVGLMPLVTHWAAIGAFLLAVGVGSSLMTIYFQVTLAEVVPAEMRGSAMALGGLGWGISHFSTPLIMGLLADRYGIVTGFYVLGAMALATVVFLAFLRQWAFSHTKLGKGFAT
jgi:MFS family permease